MEYSTYYNTAVSLIAEALLTDPNKTTNQSTEAQLYSERMLEEIKNLEENIEEHIDIAVRCQHLYRWEVPRKTYALNKQGYHQWRQYLYEYQAKKTRELLKNAGYSHEFIIKCSDLIRKKELGKNSETQLIEDTACIVFVKYYLINFIPKHPREKLIDILRKTARKMSQKAIVYLKNTSLEEDVQQLLAEIS